MKTHIASIFIAFFTFSIPAMAYIDPGSGSVIMSAVIGFFVAIGMAVKTYWYKLKSLFTGKSKPQPTTETENQAQAQENKE
jgi:hypothetical protein